MHCNDSLNTIKAKLDSCNAVLLPGGGSSTRYTSSRTGEKLLTYYGETGKYIWEYVKERNDNYVNKAYEKFPMMGICLGSQMIHMYFADNTLTHETFISRNNAEPLDFKVDNR
jgi:imidazoleglycerol phosphate synthase glutamine amidotransferase subunit HisH